MPFLRLAAALSISIFDEGESMTWWKTAKRQERAEGAKIEHLFDTRKNRKHRANRTPSLPSTHFLRQPGTPAMRIITGDECGLLKETIPEASRNLNPTERGAVQASANCEGVTAAAGSNGLIPRSNTRAQFKRCCDNSNSSWLKSRSL